MKRPETSSSDTLLVGQLAGAISLASFFYYLRHNDLLLYGDAVAHINIARRVFDSQTPGPLQLGTVWLPLPHLLMLPFLVPRWLWQTGIGGSIPSLIAYVLSVIGIFRFVEQLLLTSNTEQKWQPRLTAWVAAAIYALNPNLIYLQTTAMTEPIYLAFSIWALAFFCKAVRDRTRGAADHGNSALVKCGLCLAGASLTRYDGWLLSVVIILTAVLLAWPLNFRLLRPGVKKLILLAAAAPALWLAYNAAVYRNPLEFANGPYSAKAIEQRTASPGSPPHPGAENLALAFRYFFKAAQLNLAEGKLELLWVCALLLGTAIVVLFQRRFWPALLLWTPVAFHMLSIAHSGVPVFVPTWWPFSRYNVRYGIEMLPAFAIFTALAMFGLIRFAAQRRTQTIIALVFIAFVVTSYIQVFHSDPESFHEAVVNSRTRIVLEKQLASIFNTLPSNTRFLMYLGDHVGTFERAGIPLAHVINEGNHRTWKQPNDPEGLWERALQEPASYADVVVAFDGDPVSFAVNKNELSPFLVLHVSGQPAATVYRTSRSNQPR